MTSRVHRRQVLLFLAAIVLPCAALAGLGLRLVVQERELDAARLTGERRRITRQLRQELASDLDRTALRQLTALAVRPALLQARQYDDPTVALVARVSGGVIVLPWEQDDRPATSRDLLQQGAYAERLRQAERAEFADAQPARAAVLYEQAGTAATHPVQAGTARLGFARAVAKAGRPGEAVAAYETLVETPPDVVDEHGIPIALYAARQLLKGDVAGTSVGECLRRVLAQDGWLPPPVLYLLRDLVKGYRDGAREEASRRASEGLVRWVADELARTEQALALKTDFPRLALVPTDKSPARQANTWVPYGMPPWLVGAVASGGREDALVVAVRLAPALAALEAGTGLSNGIVGEVVREDRGPTADAESLGPDLPGLVVRFRPAPDQGTAALGNIRAWSYAAALCLVIGVTLFGAYLLWRDVRREVRLAEMRSSFVSAVSHELKTPLTAIRMFAETLSMGRPAAEATRDEYLDTIVNESERLTRLLNNVLDFSKIEQGTKRYRRAPHSLAEIVRFAARAMQYPLEQQRFVLRTEIDEDVPPARVDRDAIEQAILNLLANAMKYSGESRDIGLRLRSEDAVAVIEVSDRGVGIDPAEQARIFERFYRVSGPDNDRIPGTGLGLTLVQHIAEAHDGHVTVRSAPGEGSTFALVLPLDRDRGPGISRAAASPPD